MGFNSPSPNPENEQVQYLQKIALRAENPSGPQSNSEKGRKNEKDEKKWYEHIFREAIFCCHWGSTFSGSLRNAALPAFEEGAPFMGTALAAYKQCIEASDAAIFTKYNIIIIVKIWHTNIITIIITMKTKRHAKVARIRTNIITITTTTMKKGITITIIMKRDIIITTTITTME